MEKADMIYDLSLIWSTVKDIFPYFDRLPFDWDERYRTFLEKILSTVDERDFHNQLSEFMAGLNDGHTKYIPPAEFREKNTSSRPEAPSFNFDNGTLTIRINEFLSDHSAWVKELLETNPDTTLVRLDIRDNIGGNTFYAANIAKLFIPGVFHGCQKWTQLHRAIDDASASQIAGFDEARLLKYKEDGLLDEKEIADAQKLINHTQFEYYMDSHGAEDNVAVYKGPMELLISRNTVSAAEDFTAMFKSNHRATLIGEPTFGSTGTPYMIKLRCGGRAQVVSVGYRLLDGTEFIGKGIDPDILK